MISASPPCRLNNPLNGNFFVAVDDESDFDNNSSYDFHHTYGAVSGTSVPYVGNVLYTGSATHQADWAIAIGGLNSSTNHGMYNRGILFYADPLGAIQADIQTEDNAVAVLTDFGTHSMGLDLNGTAYSAARIYIHPTGATGPAGITFAGTFTSYLIGDGTSTANYGAFLNGTYSVAPIYAKGIIQTTGFIANAAIATVLGSVGPTGSHTTVQEWLEVKDTAGTIRYLPGF